MLKRRQVRRLALRKIDAEPLAGERMAVLEAGVADVERLHARRRRQLLGHEGGVGAVLLDLQPDMLARARGRLQRQLGDDKVLVEVLQRGGGAGGGVGVGPGREGVVGVSCHEGLDGAGSGSRQAAEPPGAGRAMIFAPAAEVHERPCQRLQREPPRVNGRSLGVDIQSADRCGTSQRCRARAKPCETRDATGRTLGRLTGRYRPIVDIHMHRPGGWKQSLASPLRRSSTFQQKGVNSGRPSLQERRWKRLAEACCTPEAEHRVRGCEAVARQMLRRRPDPWVHPWHP